MTGLDQDMMQKNLTCKSLREAQKDVCTYGFAFVPANLLFLSLGVLLMMLAQKQGVALPSAPDDLLPMFAASGAMGTLVVVLFTIGIVAASFSSADSALTAITTSLCVDILGKKDDVKLRKCMHLLVAVVLHAVHYCIQGYQFYECYRCHLHSLLVYLWTIVGIVCLQFAYQASGERPMVAMDLRCQSACLLRHRYHDLTAYRL